jgi:putative transposase
MIFPGAPVVAELGQAFVGQAVGIKEVHDDLWLVSFMDYGLGYFDLESRVLEPLENPFGPKVSPM